MGTDPLRVYFFHDGYVRIAFDEYERPNQFNIKSNNMHIVRNLDEEDQIYFRKALGAWRPPKSFNKLCEEFLALRILSKDGIEKLTYDL